MWRVLLRIHEVLERRISSLLEEHRVVKAFLQHGVHLGLQVEELLCERDGVLEVGFIIDDSFTTLLNIGVHLLDNQPKCLWVSFEHRIHQIQILKPRVVKHVVAAGLLLDDRLGFLGDQLVFDNLEHFGLGLRL